MSKVKLLPHNQETFDKIMKLFETHNRVCAIQATGTGKSYLMSRLLEEYKDLHAIIFSPNDEIIEQTEELLKECDIHNAECITYQKLLYMIDEEIDMLKADLIIIDEFHRVGASKWGMKIQNLLNSHENSKLFGVTATPIRPSDGKDMCEEIFYGIKACNISLAEALVREIIPVMPLYVSALYTFEKEYQKMSDKINKANNSNEEKVELQKELLAAKQQLEKANGIPEIIKKYINNYNGKYIVFCKDKKHLYSMKDVVIDWFRDAGYEGKIFEYPYYSNDKTVKNNLEEFKSNKNKGLKLLFVIDKLNEGLHLKEIQGCFLLRPTCSNITYYQQIGRAIDAGSKEKRIIFDLVCNFNSLKKCNLKKELEGKIKERQSGNFADCSKDFELDKFDVVDYIQECVDVFNNIDEKIIGICDKWTEYEDETIIKYYPIEGKKVSERLLGRTEKACTSRAIFLGVANKRNSQWLKKEDEILLKYYPSEGSEAFKRLPNRSTKACFIRVHRLGISTEINKSNQNIWSGKETKILIDLYPKIGMEVKKIFT